MEKVRVVQYLVDENISSANIKKDVKKIKFMTLNKSCLFRKI